MNERQWLASGDPLRMLAHVNADPDDRKTLLFTAACCRRVWDLLEDHCRAWVEVVEEAAEGRADPRDLNDGWESVEVSWGGHEDDPVAAAFHVAACYWQSLDSVGRGDRVWQAERKEQAALVREVFGNPFRPAAIDPGWLAWNDGTVARLAAAIYEEGAFDRLPVLADALEDAGCASADILEHLRGPGPHVRGCWVVDMLLAKG